MTHPVALSKSSPVSSSTNFSQPLTIQTTTSSQSQINVASMSQPPSQPTIIVPAGPNTGQTAIRMPIQVSAVPLQEVLQDQATPTCRGYPSLPQQGCSLVSQLVL